MTSIARSIRLGVKDKELETNLEEMFQPNRNLETKELELSLMLLERPNLVGELSKDCTERLVKMRGCPMLFLKLLMRDPHLRGAILYSPKTTKKMLETLCRDDEYIDSDNHLSMHVNWKKHPKNIQSAENKFWEIWISKGNINLNYSSTH